MALVKFVLNKKNYGIILIQKWANQKHNLQYQILQVMNEQGLAGLIYLLSRYSTKNT